MDEKYEMKAGDQIEIIRTADGWKAHVKIAKSDAAPAGGFFSRAAHPKSLDEALDWVLQNVKS